MDEEDPATYEQLADLEREFDDVDTQIIAHQYTLSRPLYTKRSAIISKIPNFWPLVFEQAPEELDAYIQPSDSEILANHLAGFEVTRPDIPLESSNWVEPGATELSRFGHPRNVTFKFTFSENEWFEDAVLEKAFMQRTGADGDKVLVSEPVRIRWKKGKDPTSGLTDAACVLHDAVVKAGPDTDQRSLKEHKAIKQQVEKATEGAQSFFAWFAYRGTWLSQAESQLNEAKARMVEKKDLSKDDEGDETLGLDDDEEEMEAEVFPDGDQIATVLAEDLWPNALRYFAQAQEQDGLDMEDLDDMDSLDDEDMEGEEVIDIRSLVKDSQRKDKEGASDAPPKKKRKT